MSKSTSYRKDGKMQDNNDTFLTKPLSARFAPADNVLKCLFFVSPKKFFSVVDGRLKIKSSCPESLEWLGSGCAC